MVDLFCAIGAIRDAKLSPEPGSAVITFVKRAAAMAAITKYNGRELDKQKIMGKCSIHAKLGFNTVTTYVLAKSKALSFVRMLSLVVVSLHI